MHSFNIEINYTAYERRVCIKNNIEGDEAYYRVDARDPLSSISEAIKDYLSQKY